MAHSLTKIILHVVFSTKNHEPTISDAIKPKLHGYLAQVARSLGREVHMVGGVADHLQLADRVKRGILPECQN